MISRLRTLAAAAACLTLAAAAALTSAPGWAATESATNSSRGSSLSLSGQVVLRGSVIDANGRAVIGARVLLYAWPAPSPAKQVLHRGERVPLRLVGQAVSATGGRYTVRIASPAALKSSAASSGIVNLTAMVPGSRAGTGWFAFALRIRSAARGQVLTSLTEERSTPAAPEIAALRVSGTARQLARAMTPDIVCTPTTIWLKDYAKAWANIGSSYMRYSGVKAGFSYEKGQNTTLSVGVSGTGGAGSFTASGSYTFSSTYAFTFGDIKGPSAQNYQVQYIPAEYERYYTNPDCGGPIYFTHPRKMTGGNQVLYGVSIPSAGYCAPEPASGSFSKSTSQSSTFSAGMDIPAIGFNASAQTGWDSSNTLTYTNTNNSGWHLCGTNDLPGGNPGRLVAGVPA